MAISFVGERGVLNADNGANTPGTTLTVSITANCTKGNTLVLVFGTRDVSNTSLSITDSRGNTWTVDIGPLIANNKYIAIASCRMDVAALQNGDTVSLTLDTKPVSSVNVVIEEFSGVGLVDQTASNSSPSTAVSASDTGLTAATAAAGALAVGAVDWNLTNNLIPVTITLNGTGTVGTYTAFPVGACLNPPAGTNEQALALGYQICPSAAAQRAGFTWASGGFGSGTYQAAIVTYRAQLLATISDTGLSMSSSVARTPTRALADTGLSIGSSIAASITRAISSTGASVSDGGFQESVARVLASTGLSISDSIVATKIPLRTETDTGLAISDSIAAPTMLRAKTVADTGLTVSSAVAMGVVRAGPTDTGIASSSSSIVRVPTRSLIDTLALGSTSSIDVPFVLHHITDTGLTIFDVIGGTPLVLSPGRETPVMFGSVTRGTTPLVVVADTKLASRFACPAPCRLVKLVAYMDGLGGGGGGPQAVRGVIYDPESYALIAVGDEVLVANGAGAAWVDLPFTGAYPNGLPIAAGEYEMGFLGGQAGGTIRAYGTPFAMGTARNLDSYIDGPSDPFGGALAISVTLSLFAVTFAAWTDPAWTDFQLARLPFPEAQEALAVAGRGTSTVLSTLGWHGQGADFRQGSYALAQADGPFAGTAGKVLRITPRDGSGTSIYAYVLSDRADVEDPLTVTRSLFQRLALLSAYDVPVSVEVLP